MTDDDLLAVLLAQEQRLVFDDLDLDGLWRLGCAMRSAASDAGLPVAIAIRLNGRQVFFAALPGSSADNEGWLARKAAVVDRYGQSSYLVGCRFRADGKDFDRDSRLDPGTYAAHGGAFPLLLRSAGCVGTVAVSGLPQADDHRFVVEQLEAFLA